MFGLDPLTRSVAIIELLLLLAFAALVGWLIARFLLNARVRALQVQIADREAELEKCRRSKVNTYKSPVAAPATPPATLVTSNVPVVAAAELVAVQAVTTPSVQAPVAGSEDAVLNRIASRAGEINFDRIGRAAAADADDLKEIVGVGPFLERKLHSLGIYTFRQVGNFVKEDIDKVNEIIEFFPGRIERDNWVGQSKLFYEKKYTPKTAS